MKRIIIFNIGSMTHAFCLLYAAYDMTFGSVEPVFAIVLLIFGKVINIFADNNEERLLHKDYDKNMKKYEENKYKMSRIKLHRETIIKKEHIVLGEVKVAEFSGKKAMMAMLLKAHDMGADAVISIHDYHRVSVDMLNWRELLIHTKNVMFVDRNDTYLAHYEGQKNPIYFYEGIAIKYKKEKNSIFFTKKKYAAA